MDFHWYHDNAFQPNWEFFCMFDQEFRLDATFIKVKVLLSQKKKKKSSKGSATQPSKTSYQSKRIC